MEKIEIPVSLGIQAAENQVSHLRKILTEAVKIDSTAFRGLSQALQKAENDVARLKSQMSTAFQSTSGSKKFLSDYDKLFESLATIGNRFGFLKESEMIFSPENAEAIKNARAEMAQLSDEIQQIKSGKVGKLFEDDSVASIKEVRDAAAMVGATLSKITFQDFSQKIHEKTAEIQKDLESTTKQIELFKQAANNTNLSKDSIFSQMDIDKLIGNTTKVIDKRGADDLRTKIANLYENFGLKDIDFSKTIRAGTGIDQIFTAEEERIRTSTDKYADVVKEQQDKVKEILSKFDKEINKNTSDGKRANANSKLEYIENIKKQFSEFIKFSEPQLGKGFKITEYINQFKKELSEGIENLSEKDIAGILQLKVQEIFNQVSTKNIISDSNTFKTQVETMLQNAFGNIDLKGLTEGIKNGMNIDDALDRILSNVRVKFSNLDTSALEQKVQEYRAALNTLSNADQTLKTTEKDSTASLKEKEEAFQALAEKVTQYVAAQLGITTGQVQAVLRGDTDAANQGRAALEGYVQSLNKLTQKQQALGNIQTAVNRWMGFWQVLNMTKSAINDMKQHIQELDSVMTSISVVTNFSQEDLWGQISQYSKIARQYGVAIKGVYEVSQIYYQQGLQQNDVMTLTTETLKMARIAGLDYATAADYMTTAIRGFKLEMTDAAHVTDVFSALAATTASDTQEIAVAISKTAASAEAVGASFEATSAMMATMISTTRESATNIGTALKSVISRYGEMTSDPSKTVDSEGEEMSLNRVDKALQTVGITLHDTAGQFRDFDDVMLELMEKWDSLDSLSQRYIATLMAGNRQQSRFLALVSNVDEYKKALQTAMDSEGTGELQTLKTLDSIDAKIEKMKVTIQEFYTSSGLEDLYKNVLDIITNIVSAANSLPKAFDKIPLSAIAIGASIITAVKSAIQVILIEIQAGLEQMKGNTQSTMTGIIAMMAKGGREGGEAYAKAQEEALNGGTAGAKPIGKGATIASAALRYIGAGLSLWGAQQTLSGMNAYGASTTSKQDQVAAQTVGTGGILGILGSAVSGAAAGTMIQPGLGTAVGAGLGLLKGVAENFATLTSASKMYNVTLERQIELNKKAEQQAKEQLAKDKGEEKSLSQALDQLNKLKNAQYESAEAAKEYTDYMNQLGDQYPKLIESIDQGGNTIIGVTKLEEALAQARSKTASSTIASLEKEKQRIESEKQAAEKLDSIELPRLNIDRRYYTFDTDIGNIIKEFGALANKTLKFKNNPYDAALVSAWMQSKGWNNGTKNQQKQYNEISTGGGRNDRAITFLTENPKYRTEILDWALTQYKQEQVQENSAFANFIKSKLDTYVSETKDTNILGYLGLDNTEQLLQGVTYEKLISIGKQVKQYQTEIIGAADETLNGISEALTSAKISEEVQSRLNKMADKKETKRDAEKLQKYLSLMSFIYSGMGETIPDDSTVEGLEQWLLADEKRADKLLNLDYSHFRNISDIANYLGEDETGEFFTTYAKSIQEEFTIIRNEATKDLDKLLENSKLKNEFENLYDNTGDNELITQLIPTFRADISQYQNLIEKEQYAAAEAYLNNMKILYGPTGIGSLSSKLQQQAFSVIDGLDLSDPEALRTAAKTLEGMGSDFSGLSDILNNAALRWTTSAATLLESLSSSAQETAKSIESSIADMSKVFKYSEALEKAQALIDTNKDKNLEFDQLYTFDKDAGGYIKKAKALNLEMEAFKNTQADDVQQSITDLTETLSPTLNEFNYIRNQYDQFKALNENDKNREEYLERAKAEFAKQTKTNIGDADFDRLWQEYTQIIEAFNNRKDQNIEWNEFVKDYIEKNGEQLKTRLKQIQEMPQELARQALSTFDYTSIISGKGTTQNKEELKALLTSANQHDASDILRDFDKYYLELLKGNVDEYNKYLEHYGLGEYKASKSDANRARFEGLKSLYNTLIDDNPVWAALDDTQKTLLESIGINEEKYNTEGVSSAVAAVWAELGILTDGVIANIDELRDEIAKKAEENFKGSKAGKQYDLLSKFEGGFTAPEAAELGLLDKETGRLKSQFTQYLRQDETGNFVMRAGQNAADVIYALAQLLDIYIDTTTDQYKDTISKSIDDGISNRQKENKGKQIAQQLKTFSEASIGDEIRIDSLTDSMKAAIGVDATATTLTIESEARRDALLLLLEESIKTFNGDGKEVLLNLYSQIKKTTISRHNKYAGISKILSERFSLADAEAFAISQGSDPTTIIQDLRGLGIEYNEWTEEFVINSQKDIDNLLLFINALPNIDQHSEEFQQLLAQVNNLKTSLQNKQYNAVQDIVENYDNLSEESIAAFSTAFEGLGINIRDYVTTDEWGKNKVDLAALNQKLAAVGYNVNELFQQEITAIGDSYLQNISTGVSLLSNGTNNLADIGAFVESYNETMGTNLLAKNVSYYDDILKGFTIRPEFIRAYIQKQAENLKAQGILPEEKVDQWVQDNTAEFARENIDIGSFLSSEKTQDDVDKIAHAIQTYYELTGESVDKAVKLANVRVNRLLMGGLTAVKTAQQLNPNLTETELAEIYSNAINRWNEAFNQVENIVAGQVVTGELRQVLASLDMVDENGVVKETFDMVSVYAAIYSKMKSTAGATTADLNNAYAKLLTARDQKNIDTMDALENAANMSFDALAQLFNNFNHNLEAELPQLLKDNTVGLTGFGGIRIFNFKAFAEQLGLAENSPEYYEAYSKYADSMADFYNSTNNIIDNVAEQIKGLADAKPGKAINVSYLQQMLGNKFSEAIEGYGYMIQDGIMVLNQGADIPGLIAAVANKAAEAGQILPEQLAELADAVAEVLSQITSLITGGISGNLKNADALKLQDWATQHGFKGQLDFTQTADGLKLSNDSAKQLYNTMNNIDSIQGQIVFKALKESLIESDDSFKSISTSASEVASIEKDLNYEVMKKEIQNNNGRVSFFDKMNGNVDLYNRPILNNEDGSYSTLLTTTLDSRNYETDIPWVMNVTPITKDGKKLDDGALEEYIQKLIDGTDGSLEAILKADAKDLGLIVELADAAGKDQDALANSMGDRAEVLHEISEAYEAIKKGETFDDTKIKQYQEELNLLHEIQAERATTEDASFKFMENAIPSGQNNPLNYFENWGKAWKALQTGVKEGSMAYQDWYNIITEMNNIAGTSGQTIEIAGVQLDGSMEAAAAAIQKGAKALKVTADGSIKVDLSGFGIDLAAGANSMQEGVDRGIDAIADSQIKMLDSMIQLMETIVAMEQLGDIDVEGDGIDFSNLFEMTFNEDTKEWETNFEKFSKGYEQYRDYVLKRIDEKKYPELFNKDLAEGVNKTKLKVSDQEFIFGDLLKMEPSELAKHAEDGLGDAYAAVLSAYKTAALSGDYDENHIMESIKAILAGTGFNGDIDIGDMHLTFKQGYVLERDSEGHYIVEGQQFNNEKTALNAMAAAELEDLLGKAKDINTETGEVTYHGAMDATVEVSIDSDTVTYTAHVGEYTVTSTSREGIAGAIKTATMLSGEEWNNINETSDETGNSTFSFTIQQEGSAEISLTVDTKIGEVKYKLPDSYNGNDFENPINQKTTKLLGNLKTSETQTVDIFRNVQVKENEVPETVDENAKYAEDNPAKQGITGDASEFLDTAEEATDAANQMSASINIAASDSASSVIDGIRSSLNKLVNGGPYKVTVQASVSAGSKGNLGGGTTRNGAKESNLKHYANAKGTLMGELGPELVVSKGRYFVVGQSGPEMVDLDDDAIVFNHLQTQSLLTKGMSSGRGRAVTNEHNAVSFATGNVDGGPAMASASAALAALKQLRDMWEALKSASVSDLAGAGGGGGGGGGGNKIVDPKAWVKTVERWYNLTQEIAKLEKDITHEETLRSKLQSDFSKNGKHYYNSQRLSLKALREQIAAQEQLNLSRQDYYTKRIDALKNEPLGKLYAFDEQGQMHFRDDVTMNGQKGAMNFLTDLMGFDENGKANYTNEQKYNILKQYGFDEYMKYNSNGEQILLDADHSGDVTDEERETYYQQATEAWRDRMDNFASETQSLWDSIQEGENNLLELQADQNEILQEMRDNQMAVEEDVLKAIEDMRQREIDALQDERDKLEDSTGKYIEGLSDALSKEQEMYDNQQQENDLNQQRRRLAILQRSGGSAADIANLQNEINSNERSRYFDLQQQQIDAIQQASDLQLERMDNQIELMTETLEYQKEYGLLWSEVYDVMSHSAAQITSFIMNGNSEFWTKSPLGNATSANDTLFKADQWVEFRKDMTDITTDVANLAFAANEQKKANDYKIYDNAMKKEFGSNYDSQGKYKGIFEQVYDETGDITKASAAARAEYQKDEKAKKLNRPTYTINTPQLTAPSSTDSSSGSSNNNNKCKGCAAECTKGCAYSCTGKCVKGCKGVCGTDCERGCATGCKESCKGKCTTECYSSCLGGCKGSSSFSAQTYTSSLPKKAKGGFVNHGVYELGEEGTEGVLNAHQTRILRDNILSNKPNSLITLLNTYNEAYKDGISVAPQEASGQLIIENATVNMNVEQIANDYDARRAGEQALNEMMRIARKTGAANSIRR